MSTNRFFGHDPRTVMVLFVLGVLLVLATPAVADPPSPAAPGVSSDSRILSFEERVQCQRRLEEVYWSRRIWPESNPTPKPPLDQVLSESAIRERVAAYLDKSAALDLFWSRPLTGEQLQAEVDRMIRDTKDPAMLRELFAALDGDPFLIAECLARPALADRLARNWYAWDERFHDGARGDAEAALAAYRGDEARSLRDLGGDYRETEWRVSDSEPAVVASREHAVIDLSPEEWSERIGHLAAQFGIRHESVGGADASALVARIPSGRLSPLEERRDRFEVLAVLEKDAGGVRVATVSWPKKPFDRWLAEEARQTLADAGTGSIPPPSGGYQVRLPLGNGCVDDTWTELWSMPSARFDHTAVWTGTEMIVWGGDDPTPPQPGAYGVWFNTGGRYDPATDSWTQTSTGVGVPSARRGHTAVWTGTEMIVWGGVTLSWPSIPHITLLNSGGRYNPVTDSWTTTTITGAPAVRSNHTAEWTGTEMIIWGGGGFYGARFDTGGRYDPATDSWTATTTAGAPVGRTGHTSVWTGTEMIVWGGTASSEVYPAAGGRYNPATNSWTATTTAGAPVGRVSHTAVWTGSEMIVWGGSYRSAGTPYYLFDGSRYDPVSDSWTATTGSNAPPVVGWHTSVWTGTEMIVWGSRRGRRYDPATDSWTTVTENNAPPSIEGHTAVWTGTEMIVWGGGPLRGGRYDPVTDTWVLTSMGDAPDARAYHTSVWTGAEMIVWGGYDGSRFNSGGRYDPATDSWTPTSTGAGVPTVRSGNSAVWTGTEMIVWGGYDVTPPSAVYFNTGGRYDPMTDSWAPTSTGTGVPTARSGPPAVWTGTEMIVWGGYDGSALNSGGRYDPATDSWTPTSTGAGVPSVRYGHSAVWTGAEMIVWGGYDGGRLNTGGRYDPATDSWAPTSAGAGVPAARNVHTAIWTGTEMIVWGGHDGSGGLNTGGRYDPVIDGWTPTSTDGGVPSPRNSHTVVWTGAEMIVWGGYDGNFYLNTGGRYSLTDDWTPTSTGAGVPTGRRPGPAVWTGVEMITWGGYDGRYRNSGGRYCACPVSTWYPDADGDGYGDDSAAVSACSQPAGYVDVGGDCDDLHATCTTVCTDADLDGLAACAGDCDESNPYCTTDCADQDADGFCVTHDCDDWNGECLDLCGTDVCIQGKVQQYMVALPDLDGNNASEIAVLHTDPATGDSFVHVKDASTGNAVHTISAFGPEWRASWLLTLADHSGNGVPEVAVVATRNDDGRVRVRVRDADTGDLLADVPFTASLPPLAVVIVPDFGGTIADEIAVLGVSATTGRVLVRIKDGSSGEKLNDIYFSTLYTPEDMVVIPDFEDTGASEIAILGTREVPEQVLVRIKDAGSGVRLGDIFFSATYYPQELFVVPHFGDAPAPEIAVLGIHRVGHQVVVRVKDASSGATLNNVFYSSRYVPETCLAVPSFGETSAFELNVVGVHDDHSGVLARLKDASSSTTLSEMRFSAAYPPDAVVVVPNVGGSPADELALLGTHVVNGNRLVRVKDSATGEVIAVIRIP